jgi:GT2 family glycosyltransferase
MVLLRQNETSQASILAVVVLYQMEPRESQSICSLIRILNGDPELAKHFSLIIYDNSTQRSKYAIEANFHVLYEHDSANAGLAAAYNFSLGYAETNQHEWLLLLDQDTVLSREFITELIASASALSAQREVASIVPKLLVGGIIYSPAAHFIDQVRRQYRRSNHAVAREISGVQQGRLAAYNSGSTLRISALRSIGGFPVEYWLDYLDHAVFHALVTFGYRMYVMHAEIEHDSSQARIGDVPYWRQHNILFAEIFFVRQTGNFFDRLLYRVWLLRHCRRLWIEHPDRRLWKEAAMQVLLLNSRTAGRHPTNMSASSGSQLTESSRQQK